MLRNFLYRMVLAAAVVAAVSPCVRAGTTTSLKVYIYNQTVDQHLTNNVNFCPSTNPLISDPSLFRGDLAGIGDLSNTYNFLPVWNTPFGGVPYASYVDHADCNVNNTCLRAQFNSNNKIFSLDTRITDTNGPTTPPSDPRKFTVSFSQPCGTTTTPSCPGAAGDPNVFGGSLATGALLDVFLDSPYTRMEICQSKSCPEAEPAFAKLWFADPSQPDVTWRIDWYYLRVLRMSANTWYFIADECDGSQVAGLSKLIGARTRPKTIFNGRYRIPFFFAAVLNQ